MTEEIKRPKTIYELFSPKKITVSVLAILERKKMEAKIRKESEEWAKSKNK